jgi:hypothetical protein
MYRVGQAIPSAPAPVADEIAKNPFLFSEVMGGNFSSLNEYTMAPAMAGYGMAPVSDEYESLN